MNWQPIESFPKKIWPRVVMTRFGPMICSNIKDKRWEQYKPTHWLELPEFPEYKWDMWEIEK
jgi:hypothetical protein